LLHNVTRYVYGQGADEKFSQPSSGSPDSFATEQDRLNWFRSLLRERWCIRAHRTHSSSSHPPSENAYCDDNLVFEDNVRVLRALYPLTCLYRNFMLAYLIEANAVITFASTGVRGMKYDGHPLIGPPPRLPLAHLCSFFVPGMRALDGRLTRLTHANILVPHPRRGFNPTRSEGESRATEGRGSDRGGRERSSNVCIVLETVPRTQKPRGGQACPGYAYRPRQALARGCLALSEQLIEASTSTGVPRSSTSEC
jgi:hypothetical protein